MTSTDTGQRQAYIITGPTSGIGHQAALELVEHGTVVLVGRDQRKLEEMQKTIENSGRHTVTPTRRRSSATSRRRWRSHARSRGCISSLSNQGSVRPPASPRCERLPAFPVEVRTFAARALHQILEYSTASHECHYERGDERVRSDRHLLRRAGQADARLHAGPTTQDFRTGSSPRPALCSRPSQPDQATKLACGGHRLVAR